MTTPLIPVFDLGGVFVDWSPRHLYEKFYGDADKARWFLAHVYSDKWNLEFDAGKPFSEGVAELSGRFPEHHEAIEAFDTQWRDTVGGFFHDTIALHAELVEAGLRTYAITNFSAEKFAIAMREWTFLRQFDEIVVSGTEQLVKPDYRIYWRLTDRFGLDPAQCVFIDDSYPNIAAAEKIGMKGIHFTGAADLREQLRALGMPIAAAAAE
jgi:FMN phosphatase YigB (HAD superfamily)